MCTEQGGEVGIAEAFLDEELGEVGCGCVDVGEEAIWRKGRGRFAADPGLDAGTAGACYDGVGASEDCGDVSM